MTAYELIRQLIKLPPESQVGVSISASDREELAKIDHSGDIWLLTDTFSASPSANEKLLCGTITVSC